MSAPSNTAKYANLNLNDRLGEKRPGQGGGPGTGNGTLTKGGLLLLSKKPRSAIGIKLSVPKPVNLPSIKKEHAGNDPSTVLVPAAGSSTWGSRAEETAAATVDASAITPASTWASAPKGGPPGPPPWAGQGGPAPPPPQRGVGLHGARHGLNPNEFPTLADGAKADVPVAKHKPDQAEHRPWADDERMPAGRQDWRAEGGGGGNFDGPPDRHHGPDQRGGYDDRGPAGGGYGRPGGYPDRGGGGYDDRGPPGGGYGRPGGYPDRSGGYGGPPQQPHDRPGGYPSDHGPPPHITGYAPPRAGPGGYPDVPPPPPPPRRPGGGGYPSDAPPPPAPYGGGPPPPGGGGYPDERAGPFPPPPPRRTGGPADEGDDTALRLATTCACGFHTLPRGYSPSEPEPEPELSLSCLSLWPALPSGGPTAAWATQGVAARNAQPQGKGSEGKGKEVADAEKEASAAASAGGRSSPTAVFSLAASEGVGASARTSDSSGAVEGTTTIAAAAGVDLLALLDYPLLRCVLQRLCPQDLHRCQRVGGRLARVAADVLQRSELQCFHSKLAFGDALLGFGVKRSWHHSSSQLRGVSVAAGEYLSYAAFMKGVRLSAWNAPFDAFLPLYLNPEHGARCMKELPMFVAGLNARGCSTGQPAGVCCVKVEARALLRVLGHMLNSLVVELMGGEVDKDAGPPTRALSDASLQAFCHLHHLLLVVALQPGSGVVGLARRDVRAFMKYPEARTKEACPDLGVLLVELLLVPCSDAPWEQFAPVLLREVLARQVRWAIKETGDWFGDVGREAASSNGDSVADVRRLRTHWECGKVGLRLVMLQSWFANALARPLSAATATADMARAKRAYDECSGLPPRATMDAFAAHARGVVAATKWLQVLAALRLGFRRGANPRAVFVAVLRQAVLDSHSAGYHASRSLGAPSRAQGVAMRERDVPCYLDWSSAPIGMTANAWV